MTESAVGAPYARGREGAFVRRPSVVSSGLYRRSRVGPVVSVSPSPIALPASLRRGFLSGVVRGGQEVGVSGPSCRGSRTHPVGPDPCPDPVLENLRRWGRRVVGGNGDYGPTRTHRSSLRGCPRRSLSSWGSSLGPRTSSPGRTGGFHHLAILDPRGPQSWSCPVPVPASVGDFGPSSSLLLLGTNPSITRRRGYSVSPWGRVIFPETLGESGPRWGSRVTVGEQWTRDQDLWVHSSSSRSAFATFRAQQK